MANQDLILTIRAAGLDTLRTKMRAALGGVQSDLRRINRQSSTEQLRSINSQISAQRRLGQLQRQIDTRRGANGRFISRQRITQLRQERQAILANSRVSKLASSRQLIALRAQKSAFRDLQSSTAGFRTALNRARIAAFAIGAIGLFMVIRSLKQSISLGINLNKEFEAMRVGVAATLAANTKITDSLGRQLTGFQAVVAAQQISRDIQRKILSITIETGGTLDTTLTAFRIALPLVLRVGGTLEDALDIVKRLNLAAIAIGIPIDLVRVQIDDILKGVITTRTLLAQVLGITQLQLRAAKEQGRLLDFIREKTQAFVDAQSLLVGKFAAVLNITKALGQEFSRLVTEAPFEILRRTLLDIIGQLAILDERTGAFKGFRPEVQELALQLRKNIGDLTQAIRDSLPTVKEFIRGLNILALAAKGAFEAFPPIKVPGTPGKDFVKRIEALFTEPIKIFPKRLIELAPPGFFDPLPGERGLLRTLLFGSGGPEDLDKDVKAVLKKLQADIKLVAALPKFAEVTQKVVITAGRTLAVLKTRLEEAKKAAFEFPKGVFAAEKIIADFLAQFDPTRTKDIEKFAGLLKRSGEELKKDTKKKRDNILQTGLLARAVRGLASANELAIKRFLDGQKALEKLKKEVGDLNEVIPELSDNLGGLFVDPVKRARESIPELRKVFEEQVGDALKKLSEDIGQSFSRIFGNILSQTKSFVASMRDILRSIVNAIIGTFISRLVTAAVNSLLQQLRKALANVILKDQTLGKIIKVILGVDDDAKKATRENTTSTVLNTTSTDTNTAAIDRNTAALRSAGGGGQNFLGGFGLPFAATAGQGGGGGQAGGGIFAGGNPFSKQNRAATAALAAAGISQIIFARSKAQKVGGALLTAAAFDPEPISKAILIIAGTLVSTFGVVFDTAARREAKRLKRVQAAAERQLITLPSGKVFRFSDAASIRGIFGSTVLERPGGRFLSVPQEAGFTTGMAGPAIGILTIQVSARTEDDAQKIVEAIRRDAIPEIINELERKTFRSGSFASRIVEMNNQA